MEVESGSTLLNILLSFLHTRVSGEESCSLESGTVVLISGDESTSYTVTDSACLTGDTTTVYVSNDVELAGSAGYAEGLVDDELKGLETEVLIDVLTVNGDLTVTGIYSYTSNGLLSSTSAVEVGLCTCIHRFTSFLSLN